jgi:hypothetical protein
MRKAKLSSGSSSRVASPSKLRPSKSILRWTLPSDRDDEMSLEQRTVERIAREFAASEQAAVIEFLNGYSGPEAGRVAWDILELSKGSLENVGRYVQAAQTDYRDVLYWAEYYENDPFLKGRDPKQMVDDILRKWETSEPEEAGGIPNRKVRDSSRCSHETR